MEPPVTDIINWKAELKKILDSVPLVLVENGRLHGDRIRNVGTEEGEAPGLEVRAGGGHRGAQVLRRRQVVDGVVDEHGVEGPAEPDAPHVALDVLEIRVEAAADVELPIRAAPLIGFLASPTPRVRLARLCVQPTLSFGPLCNAPDSRPNFPTLLTATLKLDGPGGTRASRPSVIFLTSGPRCDISVIPPALSAMGP